MPKPVYVVAAASGSVDQITGRVSLFHLVESYDIVRLTGPDDQNQEPPVNNPTIVVSALWMKEEADDPATVYETQMACVSPQGEDEFASFITEFSFTKPLHRTTTAETPINPFTSGGEYRMESRLRRKGQPAWEWRQSFPFLIHDKTKPESAAQPPTTLKKFTPGK
ncbi:MAG: hypothetical protein J2P46_01320 [Zavarzinella sp.]|nr:hypothetical protein [Zavarzinella sp.]